MWNLKKYKSDKISFLKFTFLLKPSKSSFVLDFNKIWEN